MIEPTPVSPISAPWEAVGERLGGPRVGVDDSLRRRLADVCNEVSDDDESRAEAGRDWWPLAIGWATRGQVPARPALIARPTDTSQVSAVLASCNDAGVPVTPSAGRSGVCGSAVPLYGGVVLDLCGLAGIGNVDTTSLVADLRAGTFGPDVEAGLRNDHDVTLGHWPQSMDLSTVGGWLACRGAGQYSNRYGKIEDMVIGLEVVLADGRVVRTGGRGPRSATGPDLNQLFVGSEGTLGVITEGRFRVHQVPTYTGQRAFGFRSFADGLDGCRRILRRGATPAVLRLYDETESGRSFDQGSTNVLIVLDEGDPGLVDATLAVVDQESAAADKLEPNLVDRWMEQRNDVSALAPLWRHGIVVDTVEVSARWSVLPGLYRSVLDALHGVDGTLAASSHQSHAYTDGACLYFTFAGRPPSSVGGAPVAGVAGGSGSVGGGAVGTVDGTSVPELDGDAPALDDEQQAWAEHYYEEAWNKVTAATRDAGGAISHHHGIGINRARFLPDALGSAFGVLTTVKQALDPKGILNPGKLGLPNPFGPATWP
jgi:alkyldihydroxyacetonephosphate synthase